MKWSYKTTAMQLPAEPFEFTYYTIASTLPFHLFAYLPFWNHLRFSKKITSIILLAEQLVFACIFLRLCYSGMSVASAQLVFSPLFGGMFFFLVKMELSKIAFLYIFATDYLMALKSVSAFVCSSLLHCTPYSWQSSTSLLLLFFVTMPAMLYYINRTAQLVFETDAPDSWKTLWLLPFFSSIIVFLFTYPLENNDLHTLFARILLMICMFLIYHSLIGSIRQTQNRAIAEERSQSMEFLLQLQAEQYTLIQSRIEETRRARHDLRYHWKVLQSYIKNDDFDGLASYIQQYGESVPQETYRYLCDNTAVNAILLHYSEKAAKQQTHMDITFAIPTKTIIPEPELCVILGNLLENALDACLALDGNRLVCVNARQLGDSTLVITVDNTGRPPATDGEAFYSSKRPGFGIGTESVRMIARHYHGDARFEWHDGMFYASVMLNPKQNTHMPSD